MVVRRVSDDPVRIDRDLAMWERGGGEDNPAAGLRFERAGTSEEVAHPILSAEREAEGSEGKDGATDAAGAAGRDA